MARVDPRERYDDLHVTESHEPLPPEEFTDIAVSEPADIGWVVLGYVFDEDGRLLLIKEPWADGWQAPGGVPAPEESLSDALVREVHEETGVECTPVRPHAVDEVTFENEATGETVGWTAVFYEASAETTATADHGGAPDEQIDDVRWFVALPGELFNPEMVERICERGCQNWLNE